MDDDFRKQRAKIIREIAELADPSTKQRLIRLAGRYEKAGGQRQVSPLPLPSISAEEAQ